MLRTRRLLTGVFLLLQSAVYLAFLRLDLTGQPGGVPLKYLSILLCLLFCLAALPLGGSPLIALAMGLTLGADTFLLLLDAHYLLGILLFCAVQALYLAHIARGNGGHTLWPVRLALFLLSLAVLWGLGLISPLNTWALLYFSNFLCNACQSLFLTGRPARLFSLGLWLFLCCDLCVGVFNCPGLFPQPLFAFAEIGMWLFYLPAQVLISLSALPTTPL